MTGIKEQLWILATFIRTICQCSYKKLKKNIHSFSLLATVLAIRELTHKAEEYDENFVIVLSDANFDRYGISPTNFGKILRNDQVCAYAIFIGSLGNQADRLTQRMPAGKAFVCLDTKRIPEVLKTIFTSTMLKWACQYIGGRPTQIHAQ